LSGLRISLAMEIAGSTQYNSMSLIISLRNDLQEKVRVSHNGDLYSASIPTSLEARVQQSSCIVQVEALRDGSSTRSNAVLLTNLRDISTGNSTRRERYVKEAQESAAQCYAVLADLINGSDDDG